MRYALPALLLALSAATPGFADEPLLPEPEPAAAGAANAVDPDPAQLRSRIAELERRISDLERENGVLRTQWGQATMELDRLRAENRRLKAQAPDTTSAPASQVDSVAAPAAEDVAKPQAADADGDARVAELEAEVARLRRQNEDLRGEKEQLTELAGVTAEGERVASQEARITSAYDESTGMTTVRTQPERLVLRQGSHADHYLSLAYEYPGQKMASPPRDVLMFIQAAFSGGVYRGESTLELTLDNQETLSLPIRSYDVAHRQVGIGAKKRVNKGDETLTFALDAEALRKLARSTTASGRIGRVRFDLSRDTLAMFKAVQKRLEMGI